MSSSGVRCFSHANHVFRAGGVPVALVLGARRANIPEDRLGELDPDAIDADEGEELE